MIIRIKYVRGLTTGNLEICSAGQREEQARSSWFFIPFYATQKKMVTSLISSECGGSNGSGRVDFRILRAGHPSPKPTIVWRWRSGWRRGCLGTE
jgi:hypothetical protein